MPVYTPLILTNSSNTHEHTRASAIKHSLCQLREYTDLYTRAWHNTRLMQDHVAAISFTLITIVAHQNLRVLV